MTTITQTDSARTVPFFDGAPMMDGLKAEILDDLSGLIDSGRFINGPDVAEFEAAFAAYCGDGGLRRGRERARRAAARADRRRPRAGRRGDRPRQDVRRDLRGGDAGGRRPVLVDVERRRTTTSIPRRPRRPSARARASSARAPLRADGGHAELLADLADATGSRLLEDACQAHGADRDGLRAGRRGDAAAFSFYPGEESRRDGRCGRARHRRRRARRARCARCASTARREKYRHEIDGYTARLDTIQAIVLRHKLPHLDDVERPASQRRALLQRAALAGVGDLTLPPVPEGSEPGLAPLRRPDRRARARWRSSSARAGSRRAATIRSRRTSRPPTRASAIAPGAFPVAEAISRRSASRCRSSRASPSSSSRPSSTAIARLLRRWHDGARPTTRRTGCSATSTSASDVVVQPFTNLYGCRIGDDTRIGPFVEIQRGRRIGARCKIQSHTFICDGVTIEDEVFVGHGVMFINDKRPRATTDGRRAADRGGLELCRDGGRARRLDRLGRGHPRRRADRRRRARRRRRGRRRRTCPRRSRGRESGACTCVNGAAERDLTLRTEPHT